MSYVWLEIRYQIWRSRKALKGVGIGIITHRRLTRMSILLRPVCFDSISSNGYVLCKGVVIDLG